MRLATTASRSSTSAAAYTQLHTRFVRFRIESEAAASMRDRGVRVCLSARTSTAHITRLMHRVQGVQRVSLQGSVRWRLTVPSPACMRTIMAVEQMTSFSTAINAMLRQTWRVGMRARASSSWRVCSSPHRRRGHRRTSTSHLRVWSSQLVPRCSQ